MMADRLELEPMHSFNLTRTFYVVQRMALIGKPVLESDKN